VASPELVVSGWEFVSRNHPKGAPVALAQLPDGSILVSEDLNGTLLRIASSHAKR
jgi:glucose/arabinose dehydrogenase